MSTLAGPSLLVLGLGNPIRCDDAVGLKVVESAEGQWRAAGGAPGPAASAPAGPGPGAAGVAFRGVCGAGLALLDEIEGFDSLIVVDAYHAADGRPGRVRRMALKELGPSFGGMLSAHALGLPVAIELGREAGYSLPRRVELVLVDVSANCFVFGEQMSAEVIAAVPGAAQLVIEVLGELWGIPSEGARPRANGGEVE